MTFLKAWSSLVGRQAGRQGRQTVHDVQVGGETKTSWCGSTMRFRWPKKPIFLCDVKRNCNLLAWQQIMACRILAWKWLKKIFFPPLANHGRIWNVHALICTSLDLIMIINKEIIIRQKGDCLLSFVNLIAVSFNQSSIIEFGTTNKRCSLHSNNRREQLLSQCLSSTWDIIYGVVTA